MPRHEEELYIIIREGMIEKKRGRGRPRANYISKIIKDAKVDSYKQLKDKVYARESQRDRFIVYQSMDRQ